MFLQICHIDSNLTILFLNFLVCKLHQFKNFFDNLFSKTKPSIRELKKNTILCLEKVLVIFHNFVILIQIGIFVSFLIFFQDWKFHEFKYFNYKYKQKNCMHFQINFSKNVLKII
jgi:hypothetical protein